MFLVLGLTVLVLVVVVVLVLLILGEEVVLVLGSSNVAVGVLERRNAGRRASQSSSVAVRVLEHRNAGPRVLQPKSLSIVIQVLERRSAGPRASRSQASWSKALNIVKLRSGDVKGESRLTTHLRVLEWITTSNKTTCTRQRPSDVRKATSYSVAHVAKWDRR
ncbi:hypothetical protein BDZ89DRAFT_1054342 [Hymenopellis radicata]|nr:hypothetical protein BDZ89DRAFT_1054342 [Hymenopellis radicata]